MNQMVYGNLNKPFQSLPSLLLEQTQTYLCRYCNSYLDKYNLICKAINTPHLTISLHRKGCERLFGLFPPQVYEVISFGNNVNDRIVFHKGLFSSLYTMFIGVDAEEVCSTFILDG